MISLKRRSSNDKDLIRVHREQSHHDVLSHATAVAIKSTCVASYASQGREQSLCEAELCYGTTTIQTFDKLVRSSDCCYRACCYSSDTPLESGEARLSKTPAIANIAELGYSRPKQLY